MGPAERKARTAAQNERWFATTYRQANRPRELLWADECERLGRWFDLQADLLALDGLTFNEPSGWSVVAALAGEG